jgi:hypothetical protein
MRTLFLEQLAPLATGKSQGVLQLDLARKRVAVPRLAVTRPYGKDGSISAKPRIIAL